MDAKTMDPLKWRTRDLLQQHAGEAQALTAGLVWEWGTAAERRIRVSDVFKEETKGLKW